ncbi:MAG: hypothetical protein GYB65_05055 [Chloroflexi bacterium]|nr:hypothetical protein [Chloroflexota bacterium]
MFRAEFTLSKRQLGLLMIAAGLVTVVVTLGAEVLDSDSFGTLQKLGILLGVMSTLVGLTLLPLGDRPA